MKLLLATNNNIEDLKLLHNAGCKYVLVAFPVKNTLIPMLKKFETVFLDSGAYSIQRKGGKVNWDEYILKYAKFIKDNINTFDEYVELD
ncbi:hypothetical protein J7L85_00525, partial [candidate division WOR-3 bacterium]|nr:hypothetical protein [candidate division WOR-3 bacterium]